MIWVQKRKEDGFMKLRRHQTEALIPALGVSDSKAFNMVYTLASQVNPLVSMVCHLDRK